MQGIFLHVLADALGSVAVIFSTLLIKYDGWSGWDPLASCGIAILIFLASIPLIKSSGSKLLLGLPNEVEYSCRDALQGLSELRGVVGYAGVRVWLDDKVAEVGGHHHHHHGHAHAHEHGPGVRSLTGVIHVIAAQAADVEDVGERASQYLKGRGLDLIVHVETEGSSCWCGSGALAMS
jgi:zinc transporter 5/7